MTGSFHISLFEGTLHVDKIHVRFKIANITGRPISHRNGWSFRVYMIPLRDFVPEWNSRPGTRTGVNSRRGDSRGHDILWWYHVNKYRAMRGNRSELAPGRKSPRCHVNTPLHVYQKINSILFPDLFPRQQFLFPDSRLSDRSVVNRDIKKLRNKAFFMIGCKHTGEIEYDLTKTKKFSLIRHLLL